MFCLNCFNPINLHDIFCCDECEVEWMRSIPEPCLDCSSENTWVKVEEDDSITHCFDCGYNTLEIWRFCNGKTKI